MNNRKLGIAISYVNTFLNMFCGLFLSSFLLRMLGQTDYGIYQTVCSFANYLILLEFGTGTVITRNVARCRATEQERNIQRNISTIWTVNMILTMLIVAFAVLFYCAIPKLYVNTFTYDQIKYAKRIFAFQSVYLIVSFFTTAPRGVILGFERYQIQPIVAIIRLVIRTTALILLISCYRLAITIVFVDLAISLAVLVFDIWYCRSQLNIRFSIKGFDTAVFWDALPLCLAILIQCVVNQANTNVDKFILGIKLSPESVAIYSVGLYIYSIFSSLTTIPISMYAPQTVKAIGRGISGKELENFLIQPSRLIILVGGTILFGFVSVGRQFIVLVYGVEYTIAWAVALIIMLPILLNMSNGVLINVLDALNLRLSRSFVLLFTTVTNILLTLLLVDRWGMIGASIATAVCTILGQITLMNIYYVKKLHIDIFYMYHKTFRGILGYQLIASVVAYVTANCIHNIMLSFFIGGIIYVMIFFTLFLWRGAREEEKTIIIRMLQKFKRV